MANSSTPLEPELPQLKPLWEIFEDLKKEIKTRDGKVKYSTGLTELDKLTFGLWKKELLVAAARTSEGKSMFTLSLAKELADIGEKVIFFSLEMSKEQLVERLLTNICHINNLDLREGKAWKQLQEKEPVFKNWIENAKLLIDDQNGYTFENIMKVVNLINPDWVIVDYIQMVSQKGYRDKLSALDEFIKEIHRVGKDKNYGTILVSQVNRQGVGGSGMHHLKSTGTLEEHADSVYMLEWDKEKAEYNIRVEKNRHGACGKIKVDFKPQYSEFNDSAFTLAPNRVDVNG